MRIGIIGRHPGLLDTALDTARASGHAPLGTTSDAEAFAWIEAGRIDALVIGGGVEAASRAALTTACAASGVQVVDVFGPGNLRTALASLDDAPHPPARPAGA